jgi:hypothetical protein
LTKACTARFLKKPVTRNPRVSDQKTLLVDALDLDSLEIEGIHDRRKVFRVHIAYGSADPAKATRWPEPTSAREQHEAVAPRPR